MQRGFENLILAKDLVGSSLIVDGDDAAIVAWVRSTLPVGVSSVAWWHLPDALIEPLEESAEAGASARIFERARTHVRAGPHDQVTVFWKGNSASCTLMLEDCRVALVPLLNVDGVTYIVATEAGWGMEFNFFHHEVYAARFAPRVAPVDRLS